MRSDPLFVACEVRCPGREEAARIQDLVQHQTAPQAVLVDSVRAAGQATEVRHRIGDYFEAILVLPTPDNDPRRFRLVFHRRPDAGRFWKDVLVRVLRSIEEGSPGISVTLIYKGDDSLDWTQFSPA
jgi:hypothetical protein